MSGPMMLTIGTIAMTWDEEVRLASIRFTGATDATGEDAGRLVQALSRWIGGESKPFGLLGDGAGLRSVDAQYRSLWGAFLRRHRSEVYAAFFNMSAMVRVAAEMFGLGAGLRLRTFGGEAEARAWLRKAGIPA